MESWDCPLDRREINRVNRGEYGDMLGHFLHAQRKPDHVLTVDVIVLLEQQERDIGLGARHDCEVNDVRSSRASATANSWIVIMLTFRC